MMRAISQGMSEVASKARKPVLLTSAASRSQVYEIASRIVPEISVVAYEELDERANVEAARVIRVDGSNQRIAEEQ
jgi:flagellar biosynthesis component FlhA